MLIDTHFHLDLMDNMDSLIREFRTVDVGIIAVGTTPKAYTREKRFCCGVDNIKVGLGMHPQIIAERAAEVQLFLEMIRESTFIGEVGLDFNHSCIASKVQQCNCFREIARTCAKEGGKILSLHSVKAAKTVTEELESARTFSSCICIFHWFTGTPSERRHAIDAGAWFSINPKMIKTKTGQETIRAIPRDRILLETDAPFSMKFRTVSDLRSELNKMVEGISIIRDEDMYDRIKKNSEIIMNI